MATYKTYKFDMPVSTYKPTTYSDKSGAYASDIAKAQAEYNKTLAAKPAAYQSQYAGQVNNVIDRLNNRSFSYDVNSDALFQQLKSLYNEQGKLAMADTQGQAAALTGGYGNSYGVAASQQAYQQAQSQLYDRIPELYQLALSRYQQEGNDLKDQYSVLTNQDATDYGRYRDTVSDYENERAYRETALRNLQSMNQNLWAQNENNAYNANNQAWNNYWTAEQQTAANRAQAVSEDQYNSDLAYRYAALQQAQNQNGNNNSDSSNGGSTYQSVFSLDNGGENRFSNPGTLFTDQQYRGWRQQVTMNRGTEGRCQLIDDALSEGKITEKQAQETMKDLGITTSQYYDIMTKIYNNTKKNAEKRS